jgi:hypothetical protein
MNAPAKLRYQTGNREEYNAALKGGEPDGIFIVLDSLFLRSRSRANRHACVVSQLFDVGGLCCANPAVQHGTRSTRKLRV